MVNLTSFSKPPSRGGYVLSEVIDIAKVLGINPINPGGRKKSKQELVKEIRNMLQSTKEDYRGQRWFWAGILPVAHRTDGTTVYLLGREQSGEWSIIGGGRETSDPSPLINAAREGYEETMGFLGSEWELIRDLLGEKPYYIRKKYFIYPVKIAHDSNLPKYFRGVFEYFRQCMLPSPAEQLPSQIPNCPSGYFELTGVEWFTKEEILEMLATYSEQEQQPGLRKHAREIFKNLWLDSYPEGVI